MKSVFLLSSFFLFSISLLAADGKNVSYKSGDETVQGVLYVPAGKGPFPGLVVIHEWWGLNDWRIRATRLWPSISIVGKWPPRQRRRTS